jgi:peptidoglycan hydrolase-like amidase
MGRCGLAAATEWVNAANPKRVAVLCCLATLALSGVAGAGAASTSAASTHVTHRITQLTLDGHGEGAGLGMGQWGAFGYAVRYHRSYSWILNHFYGGTTIASLPAIGRSANPIISVLILENLNATTGVGYDPVVTSAESFSFTSAVASPASTTPTLTPTTVAPTTPVAPTTSTIPIVIPPLPTTAGPTYNVPAGQAVDLALQSNGTWNAYLGSSCSGATAAKATTKPIATGLVDPIVSPSAPTATVLQPLVSLCRHDGIDEPMQGGIQAFNYEGFARTLDLVSLQGYLDGVVPAEESASWGDDGGVVGAPQSQAWGFQALEAQAIAARSYVLASAASGGWLGFADICDTTACQAYVGAAYQTTISNLAVSDTSGAVLATTGTATVVLARYAASTGGWSAAGEFPSVRDFGDTCFVPGDALECNPFHDWVKSITGAAITRAYRVVGRLQRVRVIERNGHGAYGGRALQVLLKGTKGQVVVTGDQFAIALGLPSAWFAIGKLQRA